VVISFSARHLSYVLFRRRKVFFTVIALCLAAYGAFVLPQKPEYESTASIVVKIVDQDNVMPDRVSQEQNAMAPLAIQIINSVQVIITSPDVLESALSQVGIDTVYPQLRAKAAKLKVPLSRLAAEKLGQDVSVKITAGTNVLTLSLFNGSPGVARATLNALIAATVTKHSSVMRDPRLVFLERKLTTLKTEADSAQSAVLEFKQRTHITSFDEERSLLLKQRDSTQASRNEIEASLFAATGRAKSLEDSLGKTPSAIAISDENDRASRQIDSARERLTAAEARYAAAQQRFREGNPELLDQKAQLDIAREDFQKMSSQSNSRVRTGANPVSQALTQSFSTARSDVNGMKASLQEREQQLQGIDARLAYLNTNEIQVRELERRRDLAEREYRSYLERAQSARIVSDMNEAGITSLSVLQSPTLAYQPARPRKLLLLFLSLLGGVLGGLVLAIVLEMMDDTIALPDQIEANIGLPLLAVVNHQGHDAP
jgi:succinoglycan biosynthesis transport protein ExoP